MVNIQENKSLKIMLFSFIFFMQTVDNIFTQYQYAFQPQVKFLKNIFLLLSLVIMIYYILKKCKNVRELKFFNEILYFIIGIFVIALISLILIIYNQKFNIITINALIKITFPLLVSFVLINFYSIDELKLAMKISLLITFIGYIFFDLAFRGLTWQDIASISFVQSFSPFESHYFSPQAMAFCCFFMYYREDKLITFISALFVFMTYKRLMIVAMIVLFLLPKIFNPDYKLKKIFNVVTIIFFVLSSYILLYFLKAGNISILGITFDQLTMGRSYFYRLLMETGFSSYGLNTSVIALGRDLEMDLIKLLLEVGFFGLFAYISSIVLIGGQKLYNMALVIFVLGNSLISHFFDITYFWIVFYITIYCIKNNINNANDKLFSVNVYNLFNQLNMFIKK